MAIGARGVARRVYPSGSAPANSAVPMGSRPVLDNNRLLPDRFEAVRDNAWHHIRRPRQQERELTIFDRLNPAILSALGSFEGLGLRSRQLRGRY